MFNRILQSRRTLERPLLGAQRASSSGCSSASAADGMVCSSRGGGSAGGEGAGRAGSAGGDSGGSSACTAGWRVRRGRGAGAAGALAAERDVRHVPVDAVALEPDESLRDDDRLESCDVLRATSHEAARRGGGGGRP